MIKIIKIMNYYIFLFCITIPFCNASSSFSSLGPEILSEHILPKLSLKDAFHFKISSKDNQKIVDYFYGILDQRQLKESNAVIIMDLVKQKQLHLLNAFIQRSLNEENGVQEMIHVLASLNNEEKNSLINYTSNTLSEKIKQIEVDRVLTELKPIQSDLPLLGQKLHDVFPNAFRKVFHTLFPKKNPSTDLFLGRYFTIRLPNHNRYVGQLKNGIPNGFGYEYIYIHEHTYSGIIRWGKYKDGAIIFGNEMYRHSKQIRYQGPFKDGLWDRYGKEMGPNGQLKYHGSFRKGKYHGKGVLYDGGVPQMGGFINNRGTLDFIGEFIDGEYDLEGLVNKLKKIPPHLRADILNRSSYYIFNFLIIQNLESLIREDPSFVDTYFKHTLSPYSFTYSQSKNGMIHGYGVEYSLNKDGTYNMSYKGIFKENEKSGGGKLYKPDGSVLYKGRFKNDNYHGFGELNGPLGDLIYAGYFQNGLYEGFGVKYTAKTVIVGTFKQGEAVKGETKQYKRGSKTRRKIIFAGREIDI